MLVLKCRNVARRLGFAEREVRKIVEAAGKSASLPTGRDKTVIFRAMSLAGLPFFRHNPHGHPGYLPDDLRLGRVIEPSHFPARLWMQNDAQFPFAIPSRRMVRCMQRMLQIIVWVFPVVIPGPG